VRDNEPVVRATYWVRHPRGTSRACFHARSSDSTIDLPLRRPPKLDLARRPSSSEFLCALVVPPTFRSGARLLGFQPSSRHHRFASTTAGASQATCYVPSSGFLNLSTVCSAKRPTGLFHPAATSRVLARSGASPLVQPFFPHREELPPCRSSRPSSPAETGCQSNAPRLRGFSPHEVALSPGLVLPAPRPAPLFEFPVPPGVLSPPCPPVPRLAPLMTFVVRDLRLPAGLARPSSAFLDGDSDSRHLCPGQPARNFRAFLWFRHRSSSPG